MDFGKLTNIEKVAFKLPPDPEQNKGLLDRLPVRESARIYLGPTGYNMKQWVGKWYPPGTKDKHFLRHYGEQFNTIEHNTTHYRIPDLPTVARWRDETPGDFRFCPKIPQSISHAPNLGLHSTETRVFCNVIRELGEKLGCCFMQLPPGFGPRDLVVLEKFLESFPKSVSLAIEVRHPLFFKAGEPADAFFDLLNAHGCPAVITDVAGRRDVCHLRLTAAQTLIRFVGNGLHPSDYTRVQDWANRLNGWFDAGLHEAYFFTHEPDNILAPELAQECATVFSNAMPDVSLRGPSPVAGQQGSLF